MEESENRQLPSLDEECDALASSMLKAYRDLEKKGFYVVDGVLRGGKSLISNEEQILKKFTRF